MVSRYRRILRTCGMRFLNNLHDIILRVLQCFLSLFQFPTGHSQWNLVLTVMVNCKALCRNDKRYVSFCLLFRATTPMDITYCVYKSKITWPNVSALFALNFNIQSSCFGITSRFHSVLMYCGIKRFFLRYWSVHSHRSTNKNSSWATIFGALTPIFNISIYHTSE